jgi:hypothetical protein
MKVRIISVHGHGDYDKEHVLMEVLRDCDIGNFILADSTYTNEHKISNRLRHILWIPDKFVKQGDLVSVWTKSGTNTTVTNDQGRTIHRFFWDLKTAVWNDEGDCAVLFDINAWRLFPAK